VLKKKSFLMITAMHPISDAFITFIFLGWLRALSLQFGFVYYLLGRHDIENSAPPLSVFET